MKTIFTNYANENNNKLCLLCDKQDIRCWESCFPEENKRYSYSGYRDELKKESADDKKLRLVEKEF